MTRLCPTCNGVGKLPVHGYDPDVVWNRCPTCDGKGVLPGPSLWARLRAWLRSQSM